jgi:hypothetical protein
MIGSTFEVVAMLSNFNLPLVNKQVRVTNMRRDLARGDALVAAAAAPAMVAVVDSSEDDIDWDGAFREDDMDTLAATAASAATL